MSMRVNKLTTFLEPDEAYTIIEFIDQLRDVLMQNYGDDDLLPKLVRNQIRICG